VQAIQPFRLVPWIGANSNTIGDLEQGDTMTDNVGHPWNQFVFLHQLSLLGWISLVVSGSVYSYWDHDRNEFALRRTHLMVLYHLGWFTLCSIRSNHEKI
jgi:hypothetical protein